VSEPKAPVLAEAVARIGAENARLLARLAEGEQRLRLISRGVLRLQEAERGRISRELHDGVGQSLTALKMQLQMLEQQAARENAPLEGRLAELSELADRTLQEVRQLSRLLRPQMLDDLGLLSTLRWLARTVHAQSGLQVQLAFGELEERFDPDVETLVFRVAQEALTNAVKHAGAAAAEVALWRDGGSLGLRIHDDGVGFDAARFLEGRDEDPGFGLRGMRDRLRLFGGRFEAHSAPGAGTTLEARIPLGGAAAGA
jgi:signal transduction histidine kinase